uniref:Glutaredoxin domain-containing protein n=1 Tax=Ascaris lumbricoides TaxID=6252 RepID=A0A0M3IIC2_ASCLU
MEILLLKRACHRHGSQRSTFYEISCLSLRVGKSDKSQNNYSLECVPLAKVHVKMSLHRRLVEDLSRLTYINKEIIPELWINGNVFGIPNAKISAELTNL